MSAIFETLEARQLLSAAADAFVAEFDEAFSADMTREEVAVIMEEAGLDGVYARTDWNGENYWFQTSDGDVWALWHGGAVHDPDGDGAFQWNLTNISDETGVASGLKQRSLSATFTPWRAMNIVGLTEDGQVVTYWWSPESGQKRFGANGNGWCLTNLNDAADFGDLNGDGEIGGMVGVSVTRMTGPGGLTIQIIVDNDLSDDDRIVLSFRPGDFARDGKHWRADKMDRKELGSDGGADDIVYMGDTTIAADETIEDNIRIVDGTLTILGTVEGNIRQSGAGSVVVDGGLVTGNIDEDGDGDIVITAEGEVTGNITERGFGDILIEEDGLLTGNAAERGFGGIRLESGATVEGNLDESGPGDVVLIDSLLEGNLIERGPGAITVTDAEVRGNIDEWGPGGVEVIGESLITGNVTERGPDDVIVDDLAVIEGDIRSGGPA